MPSAPRASIFRDRWIIDPYISELTFVQSKIANME
jgi:hypothetical protein